MARNDYTNEDSIIMRPIGPDESEMLVRLVREVESLVEIPDTWKPYDDERLVQLLDNEVALNLGLYDGDDLVGAAFLVRPEHTILADTPELSLCGLPSKGSAEITHIMLNSDWRGYGYANTLVDELVKLADATRGMRRVYALVHPNDMQSRKLFERSLFVTCCSAHVPDGRELFLYQRWFEDKTDRSRK